MEDLAREHGIQPHQIKAATRTWPDQTITFEHEDGETTVDLPQEHHLPEPDIGEWEANA